MDASVFRPFEIFWVKEVPNYWSHHPHRDFNKARFSQILSSVWDCAVTPKNIQAGFTYCSIYPYNPLKIVEETFASSDVTEVPSNADTAKTTLQSPPSCEEAQARTS